MVIVKTTTVWQFGRSCYEVTFYMNCKFIFETIRVIRPLIQTLHCLILDCESFLCLGQFAEWIVGTNIAFCRVMVWQVMDFKDCLLPLSQGKRRMFLHLMMKDKVEGLVASCYKCVCFSVFRWRERLSETRGIITIPIRGEFESKSWKLQASIKSTFYNLRGVEFGLPESANKIFAVTEETIF